MVSNISEHLGLCRLRYDDNFFLLLLQLMPEDAEEFVTYLTSIDRLDEAASRLADIINNEKFISKEGKSKHQVHFIIHYITTY